MQFSFFFHEREREREKEERERERNRQMRACPTAISHKGNRSFFFSFRSKRLNIVTVAISNFLCVCASVRLSLPERKRIKCRRPFSFSREEIKIASIRDAIFLNRLLISVMVLVVPSGQVRGERKKKQCGNNEVSLSLMAFCRC